MSCLHLAVHARRARPHRIRQDRKVRGSVDLPYFDEVGEGA